MSEPVPSEELAWRYAEKILRKHPPMYLAIKDTVASFEALGREIEAYNEKALARYNPAKMLVMIHAGVLYEKCPNTWMLKEMNGKEHIVVRMFAPELAPSVEKAFLTNGLKGYHLYTKLLDTYERLDIDMDASYEMAREILLQRQEPLESIMDELEGNQDLVGFIFKERDGLEEKGACLAEAEAEIDANPCFMERMKTLGLGNPELIRKIREFYHRICFYPCGILQ